VSKCPQRITFVSAPERDVTDFYPFLFVYYIFSQLFLLFKWSNRWLESLGEWTSIFEEESRIPGFSMAFVL